MKITYVYKYIYKYIYIYLKKPAVEPTGPAVGLVSRDFGEGRLNRAAVEGNRATVPCSPGARGQAHCRPCLRDPAALALVPGIAGG